MPSHIVAMPVIPGGVRRGGDVRTDLSYSRYSEATWRAWCESHDAAFVLIDRPVDDVDVGTLPPSIQRWAALCSLLEQHGPDVRIAMIDADTMVRWDAPSLFAAAPAGFAAVRDPGTHWIHSSLEAYKSLFPGVIVPWWEYFNAGVVVVGREHLGLLRRFVGFFQENRDALARIATSGEHGCDQTVLNYFLRQEGEAVTLLTPPFNFVHCVPVRLEMWMHERDQHGVPFPTDVLSDRATFDFIDIGYIWHFTNVVAARCRMMEETWKRVCRHYSASPVGAGAQ